MKTMGLPISTKPNEKRRAILPKQLLGVKNTDKLFFEQGYGEELGISDSEYKDMGANIVTKEEVLDKDIICDPKIGDADYLSQLKDKIVFGYIHATQNADIRNTILNNNLTAVAWEDMHEDGRHLFWRNNELAGEAAIMHAFTLYGKLPYDCDVAVIGRGNTARGACRILNSLGARVVVYDRNMENLLKSELGKYDVIVNSVMWDINRKDHVIYKTDLDKMKSNSMIVDVSCDKAGCIESSIPTSIKDPVYSERGILHYVVDHTPSMVYMAASEAFGQSIAPLIDTLLEDKYSSKTLRDAIIIKNGEILY